MCELLNNPGVLGLVLFFGAGTLLITGQNGLHLLSHQYGKNIK